MTVNGTSQKITGASRDRLYSINQMNKEIKTSQGLRSCVTSCLMVILLSFTAAAPVHSAPGQGGLDGAQLSGLSVPMIRLFGDIKAFSSQAEVKMLDSSGAESMAVPAAFSMSDGKIRAEIDVSRARSKEISPEIAASIKQMGLDKMVSIVRPDKKTTIFLYPSLRGYAEVPMSKEDAANLERKYIVKSTKLAQEKIDGHSCEKNKVIATADNGEKFEALVWNAMDLKNFPIQMQMTQEETTVFMHFTNVQLTKPGGDQFEAPAGFTKYATVEKLTQQGLMKALGK